MLTTFCQWNDMVYSSTHKIGPSEPMVHFEAAQATDAIIALVECLNVNHRVNDRGIFYQSAALMRSSAFITGMFSKPFDSLFSSALLACRLVEICFSVSSGILFKFFWMCC